MLAFSDKVCYYIVAVREQHNIRVWRSLVSRLNGVQEAAGSNPVTRTKREETVMVSSLFCVLSREPAASCCADRRISICRMGMLCEALHFPLVRIQSLGPYDLDTIDVNS